MSFVNALATLLSPTAESPSPYILFPALHSPTCTISLDIILQMKHVKPLVQKLTKEQIAQQIRATEKYIYDQNNNAVRPKGKEWDEFVQKNDKWMRTMYIEDIPKTITFKEIKEYFAKNIYVHIPPNKSAKAYAFIEYETPEMAKEEVDKYPFHVDTLNVAAKTLKDSTLRALLMPEYIKRLAEYHQLQKMASDNVKRHIARLKDRTQGTEFVRGAVASCIGYVEGTTKGALRTLLGSIAAIAYVDFRSNGDCIVRFKSSEDLNEALAYLAVFSLIQVDKNDLIGTEEKEPGKGIILSALDESQEQGYWKEIERSKSAREAAKVQQDTKGEWVHVTAAGKGAILESTGIHTKFDDDDKVEEAEEEVEMQSDDIVMDAD